MDDLIAAPDHMFTRSGRQSGTGVLLALLALGCSGSIGENPRIPGGNGGPGGPAAGSGPGGGGTSPTAPGGVGIPGSPGGGGMTPGSSGSCAPSPRRIWKLTPDQYERSVQALLPAARGAGAAIAASLAGSPGFSNQADTLSLTGPHVTQVLKSAWALAAEAGKQPTQLAPCLGAGGTPSPACLRELVSGMGARAFRRDLEAAEVDRLVTFVGAQLQSGGLPGALEQFFLYLFSSPHFLFRTELGPEGAAGPIRLTGFERASALSYFLTDGPPDAELFQAARAGALDQAAGLELHARRLLRDPARASGLLKLYAEQLQTRTVEAARKDPMVFPIWTEALARELADEADAFVRQVLWSEGARLEVLLTGEFTMANGPLAAFYGLTGAGAGVERRKLAFPANQRAGFLSLAGLMASKGDDDDTAPVRRGLFVREQLLCQHVPEPPPTVNAVPPQPDGQRTQRERLGIHNADPSCAGCHGLMDPIGLALERFDGVGRFRTTDVGKPIDARGRLTGLPGDPSFDGPVELARALAASAEVRGCFVRSMFGYAHGRTAEPEGQMGAAGLDRCALDRLQGRFERSSGDLLDLAVAITTDESFWLRQ